MEQIPQPHPYEVFPNDRYISVVIPTYCRPFYLKKALETLDEFADYPYEVIVHDDGSVHEYKEQLFEMSPAISVTLFNNGRNLGLCESANRCVEAASSKYILFLNDDCFFTRPCLKDIVKTLSTPYVGTLSPAQSGKDANCFHDDTFCLASKVGWGSSIAFRKEVWEEVGGWDIRSTSAQSDNVFIHKIHRNGYWRALMKGPERMLIGNFVYVDDYKPTQPFTKGNDCSVPKLFGVHDKLLETLSNYRRESCQWWVDGERTIPDREQNYIGISFDGARYIDKRENPAAGLNDIPYWSDYFEALFGGKHSTDVSDIDWEAAKRHGQDKWKDLILRDFGGAE